MNSQDKNDGWTHWRINPHPIHMQHVDILSDEDRDFVTQYCIAATILEKSALYMTDRMGIMRPKLLHEKLNQSALLTKKEHLHFLYIANNFKPITIVREHPEHGHQSEILMEHNINKVYEVDLLQCVDETELFQRMVLRMRDAATRSSCWSIILIALAFGIGLLIGML